MILETLNNKINIKKCCLLLNTFPNETKENKNLEKTIKKQINAEWSINFNRTCLEESCL